MPRLPQQLEARAARHARGIGVGCALMMACAVAAAPDGVAQAQVVERNLPPESPRRASAIKLGTDDLLKSDDATPLGVNLQGIILVGADANAKPAAAAKGIDVSQVSGIDTAGLREQLTPFLDRPLSRKLIAEVQAKVAAVYREAGRPFVSITLPPQEVSTGLLQLRVIAFKVAGIKVTGAAPENYPQNRIRLVPGQEIDARKLETDLDWANRNPFRQVEAVFGPGKDLGMTDVNIQVTDRKPWQVYAGYANSGTRATDRNRYYVGANGAPSADIFASYQLTGSGNFWVDDGLFNRPDDAKYVSQAGRLLTPLGLRTSLEVVGDHVLTNERPNDLFRIKTQTSQASVIVRTALSNFAPPATGDLLGGVELKHQLRTTIFDGTPVAEGRADVAQLVVGWNGRWSDNLGSNTLDVRLKSNPGGILSGNNSGAWSAFTNGRVTDVQTNLVTLEYGRVTPLPKGLSLKSEVTVLASSKPLPDTERVSLGGISTVRGYVSEDGVVDQALILRNSLYFSMPSMPSWMPGTLAPFLLADVGWGRDLLSKRDTTLSSLGAGLDFAAGANFNSKLLAARAMSDGQYSRAGSWRVSVQASMSY
ncbi:ShlB/FhaC/HecB family hemolysin secretion/activation protein [Bradyrhizobium sp. CB3481]|uniref:ShlB/FhaC/HecB family hemolysin secretion/activation protein n=1 Tax=Bradyrhizobium sp. CB3481 TaxID=3039158 RepID=UPI0024B152A3|nr:ShlB/FhaC/HecB family hemolysin secretion/activation protein [Bradyrhizobium sp. CB3481]WFU19655.1 ShlB/FhaC/HecB family hemolysin secretion/activation protein [Bradyrhizobium sp. CB3481]